MNYSDWRKVLIDLGYQGYRTTYGDIVWRRGVRDSFRFEFDSDFDGPYLHILRWTGKESIIGTCNV